MVTWQSLYAWVISLSLSIWNIVAVSCAEAAEAVQKKLRDRLAPASGGNKVAPSPPSPPVGHNRRASMTESVHGGPGAERLASTMPEGRRASTLTSAGGAGEEGEEKVPEPRDSG